MTVKQAKILMYLSVALVALGFAIMELANRQAISRAERAENRLSEYCAAVHAALVIDALDLSSISNPQRREAAADRFLSSTTYHSEQEIALCARTPPDLRRRDACWLNRDTACLAELALAAADSTEP